MHVTLKNIISRSDTSIIIEPVTTKKGPEIKLTLPDYKICSVIEASRVYPTQKKIVEHDLAAIETDNVIETFDDNVEPINEVKSIDRVLKEPEIASDSKVCPVCGKSFTSKTWFAKHMQNEHTRKYTCAHCPKSK